MLDRMSCANLQAPGVMTPLGMSWGMLTCARDLDDKHSELMVLPRLWTTLAHLYNLIGLLNL